MKHPTSEEWLAFLYNEDESTRHAELQAHSRDCAECAARLRVWWNGKQLLDEWPTRFDQPVQAKRLPLLKVAVASVLMVSIGLAIGNGLRKPSAELAGFKAEILQEFDQRLAATLASSRSEVQRTLTKLAQAQDERRAVDRDAIIAALRQLDAQYSAQLAGLRSELETVALNTEDGLLETHQKLGRLVSSAQPEKTSPQ